MREIKTSSIIEFGEKRIHLEKEIKERTEKLKFAPSDEQPIRKFQLVNSSEELADIIKKEGEYEQRLDKVIAQRDLPREIDDKRVDIFVITYNQLEMEKECVSRIMDMTENYFLHIYRNRKGFINTSKIWNYFLENASCKYIFIMDSDAFIQEKGWLNKMLEVFEIDSQIGVIVPVAGKDSNVSTFQREERQNKPPYQITWHFSGYCFLVKREVFEHYGKFDEDYNAFGQDSDFCERMLEDQTFKIYCQPQVVIRHGKEHGGSESLLKAEKNKEFDWELDAELSKYMFEYKKKLRLGK